MIVNMLHYIYAALVIIGFQYDIPICLNIAIGGCLGFAIGYFYLHLQEKKEKKLIKKYITDVELF